MTGARGLVIFDWNMTLAADGPLWQRAAITKVFEAHGKKPPTVEEYFRESEQNNGKFWPVYGSRGIPVDTKEQRNEINQMYKFEYYAHINEVELSPGAREALMELHKIGVPMALISTQLQELVKPLMDRFDLWRFFGQRIFMDVIDKGACISKLLIKESVQGKLCCYVGDSPSDMRHAKKAGVKAVAYLNAFTPEGLVIAANPNYFIWNFKHLPALVQRILLLER